VRDPRLDTEPEADPLRVLVTVVDRDGVPDIVLGIEPDGDPLEERVACPDRDPLADTLPLLDTVTERVLVSVWG